MPGNQLTVNCNGCHLDNAFEIGTALRPYMIVLLVADIKCGKPTLHSGVFVETPFLERVPPKAKD